MPNPQRLLIALVIGAAMVTGAMSPLVLSALAHAAQGAPTTRLAQNKALVRRWIDEGFNKRNPAVVDEIFVEDVVIGGQPIGRARLRQNMAQRLAAFPDLHVTITDIVAEGDTVVIWYAARGTHRGVFEGVPPTGRLVQWTGSDLLRIDGPRIAEGRFLDDALGLLRQLRSRRNR